MGPLSRELVSGDGRTIKVSDIVDSYRQVVSVATPKQAEIQKLAEGKFGLSVTYAATSCDTLETIKFSKELFVDWPSDSIKLKSYRFASHNQVPDRSVISEDCRYVATLRKPINNSQNKLVDIWDGLVLKRVLATSNLGPINTDDTFGNFSWSAGRLLYVCQKKPLKHVSFFLQPPKSILSEGTTSPEAKPPSELRGEEHNREENWGECLTNIHHTILAIYDVETDSISNIEIENYSLATPGWLCSGDMLVCIGYQEQPKKLGLIYCNNKPSKIFIFDRHTLKEVQQIQHPGESVHTIRVNNSGDQFLYLSNKTFGAHQHSVDLHIHDVRTGESRCLSKEQFVNHLSYSCFSQDDKWVLAVVNDKMKPTIRSFSVDKIGCYKDHLCKRSILDFKYDALILVASGLNQAPTLEFAKWKTNSLITQELEPHQTIDDVSAKQFEFDTPDGPITALLLGPKQSTDSLPTICVPHGGPHMAFVDTYYVTLIMHAKLGFQTLLINYRGSTNCSQSFLEKLCGNVGTMDVNDCLLVMKELIKKGEINPDKLVLYGGSHGGFIACHLSCQNEINFKCASIRNPVTDMPTMHATSDIPEWVFTEALGDKNYEYGKIPVAEELVKMFECSPVAKISEAHVPTLMLLGKQDMRVKMCQGERWLEALKAKGIDVQCKVYDDKHKFDKVEVDSDAFVTSLVWMMDHLH